MRFAAAVSRRENSVEAVEQLVDSVQYQMPGEIDLLAVFLTYHHRDEAAAMAARLHRHLSPRVLVGCTCEGVIGGDKEIEGEPGVSVLAGSLPDVTLTPFHIALDEWEDLLTADDDTALRRRVGLLGAKKEATRAFLLFADPFTTPIVELMEALDRLAPGVPTVGGMASGASQIGQNVLLLNDDVLEEGTVGVRVGGPVRVETVVSQGCRPIGETYLVTRAEGNMIVTLGGRTALEVVREMLAALAPDEQALVRNGLFVGIVINEYQPAFERGDFLVRSVLGADPDSGAVAVGDAVRAGQTVQFHVRDAETADEDLRLLMTRAAQDETAPTGAFLFSCNGRGIRLFDLPNHDVRGVLEAVPETPVAGFFAAGELGPVGGRSFIHGHTASIVLFRPEE
ncbi:MAG TPA: FIST N-terminal domain-containing protein [Chthonomonadaceae bacterium]|nr:FIST N-terminal domain-containing protein [Chthonomonadaceae bacterium]